jgi:hypothetical protein
VLTAGSAAGENASDAATAPAAAMEASRGDKVTVFSMG